MADGPWSFLTRRLADDRKKGSALTSVSYGGAGGGALSRLDRRTEAGPRLGGVAAENSRRAEPEATSFEGFQQGEGGTACCKRADDAGLRAIENAKRNGRWENAYHSAKGSTIPEDFLVAMAKNRKAKTFFETLNSANR